MQYKALVVDFDRTLIISKDAFPSKRVKDAIIKAKNDKKIHISIATARPFNKIKAITKELQLDGYSIVSGGAQLVNNESGAFVYEHMLEKEKTYAMCREIKAIDPSIKLWVQDDGVDRMFDAAYVPYKPFIIVANALKPSLAIEVKKRLSRHDGIFCTRVPSFDHGCIDINISHKKATKQYGIETIARLYGIHKSEIIGVGDGYNDYPLLKATGLKVAMGNAVDEIKEIADVIVPSVEEDGLVTVISTYFD